MSIFSRRNRILIPRKTQSKNKLKRLEELKAIENYFSWIVIKNLRDEIRKLEEQLFIIKFEDRK